MHTIDPTRVLTRGEVAAVLADLHRRARRSRQSRGNLVLFRLSCCCGLRVAEIAALVVGDIHLGGSRPYVHVRHGKGDKTRKVPLWLDRGTLADLTAWVAGRPDTEPVLGSNLHRSLTRQTLGRRWHTAIRALGPERVRELSIHTGRHTACTVWARHYGVVEACAWAGHSNISITHAYLHASWEDVKPLDIFGRAA